MTMTMSLKKMANFFTSSSVRLVQSQRRAHADSADKQPADGKVYLIGAGPGDPELLTVKAHRLIQQADVILIDWLVGEALYDIFPKQSERIFVGKKCGRHSLKQADINALMVEKARSGATVIRLKGGDPSVFGRLAEETDTLTAHSIPFAIVPGVTAASGVAAYSGIPLTHRECAQSVKFITAHTKEGRIAANWEHLARDTSTLVFYMGLNRVAQIQQALVQHSMRPDMPIAVVDQGTTVAQKVVVSTLQDLNAEKALHDFAGPALILIGEVVNHRQAVELSLLHAYA